MPIEQLAAAICVDPARAVLGEGPVWVKHEQALYWLDIKGLRLHRFEPGSGRKASWDAPFRITAIAPRRGGGFIGASERGFVRIDTAFTSFEVIADPEPQLPGNRFNDGKVDTAGRFWAGTMDDAEVTTAGALYRLDPHGGWVQADAGYRVTNGPAFSPDGRIMYHTDSAARTIYRFDLADDGHLSGKKPLASFGPEHGYPDGMTVDRDGALWVAFWDGWCVRRLTPEGRIIAELPVPVQRPTSVAFGGSALDRLFITSASVGLIESDTAGQPDAGGLFEAAAGVVGLPSPLFGG